VVYSPDKINVFFQKENATMPTTSPIPLAISLFPCSNVMSGLVLLQNLMGVVAKNVRYIITLVHPSSTNSQERLMTHTGGNVSKL
jgi:hypothetical protein